jgi:hypothetical protein
MLLLPVQVSVHAAANVAATVSTRGTVALWGLAPVQQLPVRLQQQQQQQVLPSSWRQCRSCCWLTFGGATAAAAAAAAGVTGLPLLLAVHGRDGVDLCLVMLSGLQTQQQQQQQHSSAAVGHGWYPEQQQQQQNGYHSQQGWGSSSSTAAAAAASGVHISGVQVLAHLDLPAGTSALKQLVEVSAAPVPAADAEQQQQQQVVALQAVLLGLCSSGEGSQECQLQQQQQLLRRLSDAAASEEGAEESGLDVWVSWTLQLSFSPAVDTAAAAAASAAGLSSQAAAAAVLEGWQLSASLPQQTRAADVISPGVAAGIGSDWPSKQQQQQRQVALASSESTDVTGTADAGDADADRLEQLSAAISCLHCPSPASPFLVTGNASGVLMFWQVVGSSTAAAASAADGVSISTAEGAGFKHQQQQQQNAGGSGPGLQLVQASCCDVGGVDFGGIVVAVALCTSAGYAAAAITCGQVRVGCCSCCWSGAAASPWCVVFVLLVGCIAWCEKMARSKCDLCGSHQAAYS